MTDGGHSGKWGGEELPERAPVAVGTRIRRAEQLPGRRNQARVGAASGRRREGRRAAGDGRADAAVGIEDLRRHDPRLVDLRAGAVQGREAGRADGLSGRRADARRERPLAGAGRVRQPDRPRRHAADDRRLHQSRARQVASRGRTTGTPTAASSTTASAIATSASCWKRSFPKSRRSTASRTIPRCGRSAAPVPARICAFTAAWERPDVFRKVYSSVGSFTNLRGGNVYPVAGPQDRAEADPRLHGRHQRRRRQRRSAAGRGPISRWRRP